jgi:two-component system, OmpR family, sensor histidine kinase QseC
MSGKRYSIRRRLIAGSVACMLVILGGIGFAVDDVARHESEEIFSARLATSARVLETLAARQLENASISSPIIIPLPKELDHAADDEPHEYGHPYETKIAFQVWHDNGTLLAKSSSAPDKALSPLTPGFKENSIEGEIWQVFALHSGQVWVLAAEKDEIREEMSAYLGLSILGPLAAGSILLVLAVNLVLAFNMRSLRDLADTISRREPESLSLIELPATPVELQPILDELNELLCRVRQAFEREQRFIDAAAHEIRTPIAALQIHVQNALLAKTEQEREKSLTEALVGVRRTTKLAEQLLAYSRITSKSDEERFEPVSLNQVCRDVIALQEPLLAQRGQSIALEADNEFTIAGERHMLHRLVLNLVDNASQYGAPDAEILLTIARAGNTVMLSVVNYGNPIPADEIEHIFRPYYRILGNGTAGSGLGLAIVKEIADQHHAKLEVRRSQDDRQTIFTAIFPVDPSAS